MSLDPRLSFFPNPRQLFAIRDDQYWPQDSQFTGDPGAYLSNRGQSMVQNPVEQNSQGPFCWVKVISVDGSITDEDGYYKVARIDVWFDVPQESPTSGDPLVMQMRLTDEVLLEEGDSVLAQYFSMTQANTAGPGGLLLLRPVSVSNRDLTIIEDEGGTDLPTPIAGPLTTHNLYVFPVTGITLGERDDLQGLMLLDASRTQTGVVNTEGQAFRGTKAFYISSGNNEVFIVTSNPSYDPDNPLTTFGGTGGYCFNPAGVTGPSKGLSFQDTEVRTLYHPKISLAGGIGWSNSTLFLGTGQLVACEMDTGHRFIIYSVTSGTYAESRYAVTGPGNLLYTGIWDDTTIPGIEVKGGLIISLSLSSLAAALTTQTQGLTCTGLPSAAGVTSGTAFQPSATNAVVLTVTATLTSVLTLAGNIAVDLCSTSGGSYTNIANVTALTIAGTLGAQTVNVTIAVPIGWYLKVTADAGISASTALSATAYS